LFTAQTFALPPFTVMQPLSRPPVATMRFESRVMSRFAFFPPSSEKGSLLAPVIAKPRIVTNRDERSRKAWWLPGCMIALASATISSRCASDVAPAFTPISSTESRYVPARTRIVHGPRLPRP
jgi:hypothetical protein